MDNSPGEYRDDGNFSEVAILLLHSHKNHCLVKVLLVNLQKQDVILVILEVGKDSLGKRTPLGVLK